MFIPEKLLTDYKNKYFTEVTSQIDRSNKMAVSTYNAVQRAMTSQPALPSRLDLTELEQKRRLINKIMMRYIEQVRTQPQIYLQERTQIDRLLKRQPTQLNAAEQIVMYKDKQFSFGKTLLMGMDFDFLMLNVCVLCFVENMSRFYPEVRSRILMGVLVAYVIDKVLVKIR